MKGSIRVLYVDDDESALDVVAAYVERLADRVTVRPLADPESALDVIESEPIDCVVSDYEMPRIDGIELLRVVRDRYPDLPFVLYTGKGSEEVASEAVSADVTDYVRKESNGDHYELLAQRIVNAVDRQRACRERDDVRRRYRALLDLSPNVVALVQDGVVVDANEPAARLLGADDPDDLVGMDVSEFVPDEETDSVRDRFRRLQRGDVEYAPRTERRLQTLDGEEVYVSVTDAAVPYDGDTAILVHALDVTDRKRREQDLEWYETAVSTVRDGIYVLDEDGAFVLVNDAMEELSGYARSELLGERFPVLTDETGVRTARFNCQQFRESDREVWTFEAEMHPKRGEPFPCEIRFAAVPGEEFRGTAGVVRDVSGRKEVETDLRKANRRLARVLNASPVALVAVDGDATVTTWNAAAEDVFGWASDAVIGDRIPFKTTSGPAVSDLYDRALDGEAVSGVDATCETCEDDPVDGSLFVAPLRDSGSVTGAVLAFVPA